MPLSGVGDAAFGGSGRVGPASRTFWVSRLLRGIRFRALLKWIIAIVPTILLTARGGRSCSVHWKGGMKPHLIQMASDHALRPTGPYPVLYLIFFLSDHRTGYGFNYLMYISTSHRAVSRIISHIFLWDHRTRYGSNYLIYISEI